MTKIDFMDLIRKPFPHDDARTIYFFWHIYKHGEIMKKVLNTCNTIMFAQGGLMQNIGFIYNAFTRFMQLVRFIVLLH